MKWMLLLVLLSSCQYHSGEMWVSSFSTKWQGVDNPNMCEYSISDEHSLGTIEIIDTCGKWKIGGVVYTR